jgi:cation:H+ antiporter
MIEHPAIAVGLLLFSVAGLAWGAEWVVLSAARIAGKLGLSQLTIGLTVVALGTSAPEFVVTVLAAIQGRPDISVGNVVGSNIFNTGIVAGVCVLVWRIPISIGLARRDVPLLLASTGLVLLLLRDQMLDRVEGLAIFALLVLYIVYLVRLRQHTASVLDETPVDGATARDPLRLLAGLGLLCVAAHFLVQSAVFLAHEVGASDWLIGVTVVAAGTSLPEFATCVMAARHGHRGIILGNLVGSDLFNLLGVLGAAAAIQPLAVDPAAVNGLWMMVAAVGLLWLAVARGTHVMRWAGAALILVALARWGYDIYRAGLSS